MSGLQQESVGCIFQPDGLILQSTHHRGMGGDVVFANARRQMAWFRRDPRIRWFDVGIGGALEATDGIAAYLEGA